MNSIWNENINRPQFSSLRGDRERDVLIIGGGIAGILTSFMMKRAGVDCMLIEANRI